MNFLPDWAPNIHPMLIHFPIVLLLTALLFDALFIFFRKRDWLHSGAILLYAVGLISLIVVYLSGRQAADTVMVDDSLYPAISEHANWALRTVWFWSILVALRFGALLRQIDRKLPVAVVFLLAAIAGNYLVFETAEHGAKLVYKSGVGVKMAETVESQTAPEQELSRETNTLLRLADGSIEWNVEENALWILKKMHFWDAVDQKKGVTTLRQDEQKGPVLSFNLRGSQTRFVFPDKFENVSLEAVVNLTGFQGRVFLLHHFRDTLNYDFLLVENGKISLGRRIQGKITIMDTKPASLRGWRILKVVGAKGHFRGYVNNQLIVHGHGKDLQAGETGLLLKGTGEVLLKKITVKPL